MKSSTQVFAVLVSALAVFSQPAVATHAHADRQFNVDNDAINIGTKNRKNLLGCFKAKPCINDRIAGLKDFSTRSNQPIAAKSSTRSSSVPVIAKLGNVISLPNGRLEVCSTKYLKRSSGSWKKSILVATIENSSGYVQCTSTKAYQCKPSTTMYASVTKDNPNKFLVVCGTKPDGGHPIY
jgi:hypothetical protein